MNDMHIVTIGFSFMVVCFSLVLLAIAYKIFTSKND